MAIIKTPRLILRPLEATDCPRVAKLIGDWAVSQWLVMTPYPYETKHALEFLEMVSPSYKRGEPEYFVIANPKDNEVMGGIGLHPSTITPDDKSEISLGYWLGKPYWGNGYMTEAVAAALLHAFERQQIATIHTNTDPLNKASINVLRKLDFTYLGEFPREQQDKRHTQRGSDVVKSWRLDRQDCEKSIPSP